MEAYVDTNGIRLHYIDHPGAGPTLILLPGLTISATFFRGLVGAGLAPILRVLAFDLRGRGLSDKPDTGYTMADHAADVIGAMDALGIDRVVLGGHSFGGLLTWYLAAHHPHRVVKGVVMDAPAEVDPKILDQIKPSLDRLELTFPSWEEYLAHVKAMPFYDGWGWDPDLEAFYRSDVEDLPDGSVRSRCRPDHIWQAVQGTLEVDWPDLVARITQPMLLIRATDPLGTAPILPKDQAERALELLGNGRLAEFPGNHITFLFGGVAATVAEEIVGFVGGI